VFVSECLNTEGWVSESSATRQTSRRCWAVAVTAWTRSSCHRTFSVVRISARSGFIFAFACVSRWRACWAWIRITGCRWRLSWLSWWIRIFIHTTWCWRWHIWCIDAWILSNFFSYFYIFQHITISVKLEYFCLVWEDKKKWRKTEKSNCYSNV
jgi:hypothetical protein